MQLILLENIIKLGKIGDQVEVKNGYGRNFLLKTGKALRANKDNIDFKSIAVVLFNQYFTYKSKILKYNVETHQLLNLTFFIFVYSNLLLTLKVCLNNNVLQKNNISKSSKLIFLCFF